MSGWLRHDVSHRITSRDGSEAQIWQMLDALQEGAMALLKALRQSIEERRLFFGTQEDRPLRAIVTTPRDRGEWLVDAF